MLGDIRKAIYFSKAKSFFNASVLKGLVVPFDDELYSRLENTYVSSMPLSIYIKYMKPVMMPINDHDRSLYMFVAMDDAILVTANTRNFEFLYSTDNARHCWIEIGDYVYDPHSLLRFTKDVYYKIFVPENVVKCTKEEFLKDNKTIYDDIKGTTLEDFLPNGKKHFELLIMAPVIKRIAANYGDSGFKCDVMAFLRKVQYDDSFSNKEINDLLQELVISTADMKDFSILYKLNYLIEAKDKYTRIHSENVSRYSVLLGEELGLSDEEISMLRIGGLLHDIGKIAVSDYILNKSASLTDSEYDIMKKHPVIGESLFPNLKFNELKQIIRSHHECFDGHGYPDGLCGEEIPLLTRIVSVADAFDAMTTQRTYNKCKTLDEALNELYMSSRPELSSDGLRQQLDPNLVEAFIRVVKREQLNAQATEFIFKKINNI